jgi:hypothetical protein
VIANSEVSLVSWAPYKLAMNWIHYTKPGNNYNMQYGIVLFSTSSLPSDPNNFSYRGHEADLFNFRGEFPLPSNAEFVASKD